MTLTLEVKDEFLPKLTEILSQFSANVKIKDKNLEYDPYFYERKKDLEKALHSNDRISHDKLWNNIKKRFNENN